MNKVDFGRLVKALREELRDKQFRLIKQEAVAEAIGESKVTIGNIERGTKQKIDADLLLRLADVLQLSSREAREFCLAGIGYETQQLQSQSVDPDSVLEKMIENLSFLRTPAYITDHLFNLLAANASMVSLYGLRHALNTSSYPSKVEGHNLMSLLFSEMFEKQREALGSDWDDTALRNMQLFRAKTIPVRFKPRYIELHNALSQHDEYLEYWQRASYTKVDDFADNRTVYFKHPAFGQLHFLATITNTVTRKGDLLLFFLTPMSEKTSNCLDNLNQQCAGQVHRLAKWEAMI